MTDNNDQVNFEGDEQVVFENLLRALSLDPFLKGAESGDVESPAGFFQKLVILDSDLETIRREYPDAEYFEDQELVGYFLYRQDNFGFAYHEKYETGEKLHAAFDKLEKRYAEWLDESEDD